MVNMGAKTEIAWTEQEVYRQFARVYPHECYDADPDKFWRFFHEKKPDVSREDMERALEKTRCTP